MDLTAEDLRTRSPRWPDETPFWPCLFFLHGDEDEILSVLYYDESDSGTGVALDERGVLREETDIDDAGAVGWCVQILARTEADPTDPRRSAPLIDVLGSELTVREAFEEAMAMTLASAIPMGRSFGSSQEDLVWRPSTKKDS